MELERLRREMAAPKLNLKNPYMKDVAALYEARPTVKKALEGVLAYYDQVIAGLPDAEKEAAELERAVLDAFREKILF